MTLQKFSLDSYNFPAFVSLNMALCFWIPGVSHAVRFFFFGSAAELDVFCLDIVSFVCSTTAPFMAKARNKLKIYASLAAASTVSSSLAP